MEGKKSSINYRTFTFAIVNLNPIWQALESPWKPISEQIPEELFPLG